MRKKNLRIYTFYKFKKVRNKFKFKVDIERLLAEMLVRGSILIADEGINASISGKEVDLLNIVSFIKKNLNIRKLDIKKQTINFLPFNRMKVKLKKEIVSLGKGDIDVDKYNGTLVSPLDWESTIKEKGVHVIDVRNQFEIDIGKFKNSINPMTKSFRDFPKSFKTLGINKNEKIAMYCTGGIRCEKASSFLKKEGYKNVVQLKGGIISYLENIKTSSNKKLWTGECFVFDDRITIKKDLSEGSYDQCYGCKHPIKSYEKKLQTYEKGVSCKYCYNRRTDDQKKRSKTRQLQIDSDKLEGNENNFRKLTHSDLI